MSRDIPTLKESIGLTLTMGFCTFLLSFNLDKDPRLLNRVDGMGILGFYLAAFATLLCCGFTAWNGASNSYSFWDERRRRLQFESYKANIKAKEDKALDLQLRFNELSIENKLSLTSMGLAEDDKAGSFLKFVCPISRQLMAVPTILKVRTEDGEEIEEIYDEISLKTSIALNPTLSLSPLSRLPIVKNRGNPVLDSKSLKKEHNMYLTMLEKALFELEMKEITSFNLNS